MGNIDGNRAPSTTQKPILNPETRMLTSIANQDDYEKEFEYANFVLEQVKFQQEARDNWFGHYLTIVGSVVGFATIVFAVFSDSLNIKNLEIALGGIFILTGLLGVLFYFLFLTQRVNYKMHYRVLNELQASFATRYLKKNYSFYYPIKRTPFKKSKFGADYFASLIQRILVSFCVMTGTPLLVIGLGKAIYIAALIGGASFIAVLVMLTIIHRKYEELI